MHNKRKETRESNCSDEEVSAQSIEEEVTKVVKRRKKRGYRKATHTIRKEEIDHLRVELEELQAQMAELQRRAFAPTHDDKKQGGKRLYSKVLHNAVKKHQEAFVEIQSAMTGYAACNIQAGSPIQRMIVLGNNELSRRETLRSMKAMKLQDAREFFRRRLSHLNPLKSMSEDYRFENDEGDYWAVRFATSQFEPAQSVKQIFDLVVYYLCNIEINVSEKMGHLTVREDDDSGEEGITQNRLVSLTGKGLHMESNTVVFSEYTEAGPNDQDGYGLIVAEFVDEDERHPYRPAERIRKDVNTVMEVRSYTRRPQENSFGIGQEEKVVVLTRWSHSRLRHPNFPVRKDGCSNWVLSLIPTINPFVVKSCSVMFGREEIRDDRYYTSLVLGPRVSSVASPTSSSARTSPAASVEDGSAHTLLSLKNPINAPCTTQNGAIIRRRKREKPNCASENDSDTAESEPQKEKRTTKHKYRKATHTLRKEEKERLLKELEVLHARMEELQKQALCSFGKPGQNDKDRVIASKVLRDAVQSQQLEFANIQGIMSEYALSTIQAGSPLQRFIHLRREEDLRRDTLLALKPMKLDDADHFLRQRRPNVDPCKPMCEDHRYELSNGDFCSTRFTRIQFHGVGSVKQVFDMLVQYFCNIEISISEKLGHITIREDDDSGDKGITQNRLVSTTITGLLMESNTVLFSQFFQPDEQPGHERGRGLIVADFVDEDDRHPYRPDVRVRRDINAILELTSYTRKVATIGCTFGEQVAAEESVVVLTRWVFSQLHRPFFHVSTDNWEEMRDNMDRWGETMHRTMVESLTPIG